MFRLLLLCAFAVCARAAEFDILIRNARIVDGSGNPWFRADVGIRDGRIAKIGSTAAPTPVTGSIDAAGAFSRPALSMFTPISKARWRRFRAATTISSTA